MTRGPEADTPNNTHWPQSETKRSITVRATVETFVGAYLPVLDVVVLLVPTCFSSSATAVSSWTSFPM